MSNNNAEDSKRKLSVDDHADDGVKKIKLSSSSLGLFGDLPNELVLQVISFLVGDLNHFYHNVDVTAIPKSTTTTSKRNLYDLSALEEGVKHLTNLIPNFDNVKALAKLSMVDKRTFQLVTGNSNDEDLQFMERFWLQGFVFFQKLAYWIRTDTLDSLQLGCGDLNRRQIEEMGRIQNVVQAIERGKPLDDLESTVDTDNCFMDDMDDDGDDGEDDDEEDEEESEEEVDDFLDGDYCSNISQILPGVTIAISGIVNPERTTLRETAMKMGAKYTPDFQAGKTTHLSKYFLYALNLHLQVAAFTNTDKTKEAINAGVFVVSKQWVYDCSTLSKKMDERRYSMVPLPKPVKTPTKKKEKKEKKKKTSSKTPLYSDEQLCKGMLQSRLDRFDIKFADYEANFKPCRTAFEMFLTQLFILSLNMFNHMDSENNQEYWSEDSDVLLTSNYVESWADQEADNNPYRSYRRSKLGQTENCPKLGVKIDGTAGWAKFITNDATNKKAAHTLTKDDITLDNIEKKLSKSIYLSLNNVLYFTPLNNYTFPDSIRFLSIDYSDTNAYCEYSSEKWKSFFNNSAFPGVRYLRLRCSEERHYYGNDKKKEVMKPEETAKIILESILNAKSLPKLEYLLLVGFSQHEYLKSQIQYLKQLYSIDIVFDYETRDAWSGMTKFTSNLSNKPGSLLKYVVVETDLDSRNSCTHRSVKDFYDSHSCPASIGRYSISRFYYSCNE